MTESDRFASSDDIRSAGQLPYAQRLTLNEPLRLKLGGELSNVEVCYETYGRIDASRSNAVFVCHALSGDSHVARHNHQDDPGWWDIVVGPGRAIDTDRYFVICANILGGCRGTTGPNSVNSATRQPYGGDFPRITVSDIVQVHRRLVAHLGIERLLAVIGGSLGGMQVLCWAVEHPDSMMAAIPIATSACLSAQALAFDVVGRNAILKDPNYRDGQYYDAGPKPVDGLAIARMIGHITYLSDLSMAEKFDNDRDKPRDVAYAYEKEFSVGSYLAYQGGRFVERFDANSYIVISLAMDMFNLARDFGSLEKAMARSSCRWLVISYASDWLFPPRQSRQIVDALIAADKPVSYCNVQSDGGHDAFLLPQEYDIYGTLIRNALKHAANGGQDANGEGDTYGRWKPDVRSIFHGPRLDFQLIEELIPSNASVLDLGCGNGQLLARLHRRDQRRLLGLELEAEALVEAVGRGINAVHADLDSGLGSFRNLQFDVVLLSQTLQTVHHPDRVLLEMLRVGKLGIVSFPNFAHKSARRQLVEEGIAPVTEGLPFKWYRTPNIHFLSIKDFWSFCDEFNVRIHRMLALDTDSRCEVTEDPNLNANMAIFVISRP